MTKQFWAHAALIAANLFYAANYTIAKWLMPQYIQAFGFILIRVVAALILFASLGFIVKNDAIEKGDYLRLFFCGIFGVAVNQLLFFKGLDLSTPMNASLMMVTTPILVILIAILAKKESFTWIKVLGIFLGAFGALLLVLGKNFNFSSQTALGDFFVFLNAVSYGIYLTIVKPLLIKYKPVTIITWVFFFGLLPVSLVGYQEFTQIQWSIFGVNQWISLIFVVVGVTFFAYLFNIYALSKVNPSVVGIYIYMQPLLAAFIALYFQSDQLDFMKVLAAFFIFMGVYFVSFYKSNHLKFT